MTNIIARPSVLFSQMLGQILLSPVDGVDPFGLIDNYAVTPGQFLNYNIPTLILSTGLDDVPGFDLIGNNFLFTFLKL